MDTHARLRQLLRGRGWTEYKLSKECGLAQSTIGNIFRRNTVPSVATLETACKGFGIALSQFFADADMVELTPDLKKTVRLLGLPDADPEVRRHSDAPCHEP